MIVLVLAAALLAASSAAADTYFTLRWRRGEPKTRLELYEKIDTLRAKLVAIDG